MEIQRKRSIKTLQKIKLENLVSKILVPNNSKANEIISNQWMQIGKVNKTKLIEFIFNHHTNFNANNDQYDYIQIPQYLLSLIQPLSHSSIAMQSLKIHKVLIVKHVNKFCDTISGKEYKKKKIKISDFEFKLHLFPNGLSKINDGFVQFFIELTKMPSNYESIVVYINLFCMQTCTKYKQTKLFKEIGDSDGWIWSLKSSQCCKYNVLQFDADIQILQIRKNDNITDYSETFTIKKMIQYEWPWKEIKNILHKIKDSNQNTLFFSDNTDDNMYCFAIESTKDKHINILCNLLRLPSGVDGIIILFKVKIGYPEYTNTFTLNYESNTAKVKLIKPDIKWLLHTDHEHLPFKISIKIKQICNKSKPVSLLENINYKNINKITNSKRKNKNEPNEVKFMQCWYEMNKILNKYYKYNQKQLNNKFLDHIERMRYNDCLIEYIIGNDRWELLYFDKQFPICDHITFDNIGDQERFISYIFEYFYNNKKIPSINEMENMADGIKINDKEFRDIKENGLLLEKEINKNKNKLNSINEMMDKLEKEKYDIICVNKELKKKKKKLFLREKEKEEKIKKDKLRFEERKNSILMSKKDIRKQKEMRLKIKKELNDFMVNKNEKKLMKVIGKDIHELNEPLETADNVDIDFNNNERNEEDLKELNEEINNILFNKKSDELEIKTDLTDYINDIKETEEIQIGNNDNNIQNKMSECNPYLDSELLKGFEEFMPDKNKNFEQKYNIHNDINEEINELNLRINESKVIKINEINHNQIVNDLTNVNDDINGKKSTDSLYQQYLNTDLRFESFDNIDLTKGTNGIQIDFRSNDDIQDQMKNEQNELPPVININDFFDGNINGLSNENTSTLNILFNHDIDINDDSNILYEYNNMIHLSEIQEDIQNHVGYDDKYDEATYIANFMRKYDLNVNYNDTQQEMSNVYAWDKIDDMEFVVLHRNAEMTLQNFFDMNQFIILAGELQHHLNEHYDDVKECSMSTRMDGESVPVEIRDIRCVAKEVIETVTHKYYPILNTLHILREFCRTFEFIDCNEDFINYYSNYTQIFFDTQKEIEDFLYLLGQPYDCYVDLRKQLCMFLTQIVEVHENYIREIHEFYNKNVDYCSTSIDNDRYESYEYDYDYDYDERSSGPYYELPVRTREHLEDEIHNHIQLLEDVQMEREEYKQKLIVCNLHDEMLYKNINKLKHENKFLTDTAKMKAFCDAKPGKTYVKQKLQLDQFTFKVYLDPDPNGFSNDYINDADRFVQFTIKLNEIPSHIKSVVIYFKLYETNTKTEYQCTKIFENNNSDSLYYVTWCQTSLSLKHCEKYKTLEFGYEIQILKMISADNDMIDHSVSRFSWVEIPFEWQWNIEKHMLSSVKYYKYVTLFYSEMWKDSFCVSFGSMGNINGKKNMKIINISLHLFKLPPKVEKMKGVFEITTNCKKANINYIKEYTFDYNSTDLRIKLNKRESEMLLSYSTQHYKSAKLQFTFKLKMCKIWIVGCDVYDINHYDKRKSNDYVTIQLTPTKVNKNKNNVKQRGNRNHKQKRRKNKKQKKKLSKKRQQNISLQNRMDQCNNAHRLILLQQLGNLDDQVRYHLERKQEKEQELQHLNLNQQYSSEDY